LTGIFHFFTIIKLKLYVLKRKDIIFINFFKKNIALAGQTHQNSIIKIAQNDCRVKSENSRREEIIPKG